LAYLTGHIAALAAGEGLTRKMGSAAMTQVQGRFVLVKI
jgi:tetrahydromethanopterin S-methyltransferase subunit D